jgi:hypothetical protein
MCIFSLPVESVRRTNIFVRTVDARLHLQLVVYEASVAADREVAMILPLPTIDAHVRFVDMSKFPRFFKELEHVMGGPTRGGAALGRDRDRDRDRGTLPVQRVGSFDASFVPTLGDFGRLDERFRIPPGVLELHPEYRAGFGFAVFKLRDARVLPHPMALLFRRREDCPGLFVPTTHAHDAGTPAATEKFDHCIYAQTDDDRAPAPVFGCDWRESWLKVARRRSEAPPGADLADYAFPNHHVFRVELRGRFENRDVVVRGRSR